MILKIFGWFWLVTGVLFLIKPDWLRNRLKRKSARKIMWVLCGAAFAIGIALFKAAMGLTGILALILKIIAVIAIIKAFLFLNGKISDKLRAWFAEKPIFFFRVAALAQIILGVAILFLKQ